VSLAIICNTTVFDLPLAQPLNRMKLIVLGTTEIVSR